MTVTLCDCHNGDKMKILVILLLFLAAHFNATPFAPAPAGAAKFYWPFAADSKSWLTAIGGLPESGGIVTSLLAGVYLWHWSVAGLK